jgi:hypothetical protein
MIECSHISSLRDDLRGVFDIATANKPAKLAFTHAVAAKLTNRDRKIPSITVSVLCESAGLEKTVDRVLGGLRKTMNGVSNPACPVA